MVQPVPETINFAQEEEKILSKWEQIDVFHECLKQSQGKPRYSFYDGPPFATGLPHYGHILAGTIKDVVTRYAHQSGFHVERRFGWDCHGLPVEYEIDKTLGIRGPEDVAKMGIEAYNAECRKIVMRYAKEWEEIVWRLGRWIDFKNDYKTMYPWFMESVWWVFRQLFDKGFVYKGFKVMPFSTACSTPLSNFESGQNYKDVIDPAVIVAFPLDEDPTVSMIAWTTTPWTLPSNLALCVNPKTDYVKIKDLSTNRVYIMMEARIEALFKSEEEYAIVDKFKGEMLRGKTYKPLFSYFSFLKARGAFQILNDEYVTEESGTGVVHQAPFFGEDDYRICLAAGVVEKGGEMVCPVDESGRFTEPVSDFKGMYVKDADKEIMKILKICGSLVHQGTVKHSYPFCWRSETPLIYKAVPSWFVRVEHMNNKLLECNQQTYWVPDYVKEKRFGNWLKDARDWAISRNRYWGTPIPIWMSNDGEEIVCIGSIEELEKLSGQKVTDLHRETVDKITIPSKLGNGVLHRVSEVFDCWFESGSMPYAQEHYPFKNKNEFDERFPADFVAEGIDQTRGWFYTLLVLGTALFGKAPFKNLVCNGLILAGDGQKMSKRKKNYPDPLEVVHKYGADALRLYLINSPAVRGDNLRFKEEGVRDILKDVFLPWYNAYRFFVQNLERLQREEGVEFLYDDDADLKSPNLMDRWIHSAMQSLLLFVSKEMAAYRLYTVVPRLIKFIDNLTNWYVRFNRKRLKGEGGKGDCIHALETLFGVLFDLIRVMSPFTPYLTEHMYQNLHRLVKHNSNSGDATKKSVHFLMVPKARESSIDEVIERSVSRMQSVIELGRIIRDRKTMPIKYPLPEIIVIHKDQSCLDEVKVLEKYIVEELNIKMLTTTTDKAKYGVTMRAEPEHRTLGLRLRGDFKNVKQAINQLTDDEIQQFLAKGTATILGHEMEKDDLRVMYTVGSTIVSDQYEAHAEGDILVMLDVTPDQSLQDEGLAREVINRIQKLRKKAHLVPSDDVNVYYEVQPKEDKLNEVVISFTDYIINIIKSPLEKCPAPSGAEVIIKEQQQLKGAVLCLVITKGSATGSWSSSVASSTVDVVSSGDVGAEPFSKYVNLELFDPTPPHGHYCANQKATILLENPQNENPLDFNRLVKEVEVIYGLQGRKFYLFDTENVGTPLTEKNVKVVDLHLATILVNPSSTFSRPPMCSWSYQPQCRYINVQRNNSTLVTKATVLLENPQGGHQVDFDKFRKQVELIFGLGKQFKLSLSSEKLNEINSAMFLNLHGKTVYVFNS